MLRLVCLVLLVARSLSERALVRTNKIDGGELDMLDEEHSELASLASERNKLAG